MLEWLLVGVGWLLCAVGAGAVTAWLYKRLHPSLAFYKLWAFWTMVLSAIVAVTLAIVGL